MVFSSLFYDDFKVFQPRLWRFYEVENLEGFDPTSSSTCRENGTESHKILGKIPVDGPFQPKCSWNIIGTCRFFLLWRSVMLGYIAQYRIADAATSLPLKKRARAKRAKIQQGKPITPVSDQ